MKWKGDFTVQEGKIYGALGEELPLKNGQYYRIVGSVFNDGVHLHPLDGSLRDEYFNGAVWGMAIPPDVITLAQEIDAWQSKYGGVDSVAMSPYNSESFGGYSYSKSGGGAGGASGSGGAGGWQGVFANRLNRWRKI